MISSFWNLCRTCPPSVPQLHSEYRSTFQWHEYVGANAGGVNHRHTNHTVVRQPTQSSKPQDFWTAQALDRPGKRINISNINKTANAWSWLRTSTEQDKPPTKEAQLRGRSKAETQLPSEDSGGGPPKSLSMGTIRAFDSSIPVQTHQPTFISSQNNNAEDLGGIELRKMEMSKGPDSLEWIPENKGGLREQMSSSYEGTSTQAEGGQLRRKEYKSEYKKQFRPFSQYEYVDGRFLKKKGEHDVGSPWYKEVIELRKKAGEYKYRGWGTDLVPQHLAELHHQNLWSEVSRRSSLAPLALITTTTQKSISKEEKDKENARKSLPKRSLSRPNTATPKHPISDFKKDSETVPGPKKKYDGPPSVSSTRPSRGKARSQSAGPGGRSPRKSTQHSVLSKEREVLDSGRPAQRHPRPSSADPSLGFSEPVIKSPPEPTRVKSPEQVILRSPDAVNWTVPLDTTKSFTVTQNIREAPPSPRFRAGDSSRSSSSHHPISGVQSSTDSTKTSSPISSFSPRSGLGAKANAKLLGQSVGKATGSPPPSNHKTNDGGNGNGKPQDKLNNQNKSVSQGTEKKPGVESKPNLTGRNLNGESMIVRHHAQPKLDNRKPDDTKNNNDKVKSPPTTTVSAKPIPAAGKGIGDNVTRKPVVGTKVLEDPQFMFDLPKTTSASKPKPITIPPGGSSTQRVISPPGPVPAPRGNIRVLEAPTTGPTSTSEKLGFVPPPPVASTKVSGVTSSQVSESLPTTAPAKQQPSYKVLEAPDPSEALKTTPTSTGKSKHKFDFKFWGKKDNEK